MVVPVISLLHLDHLLVLPRFDTLAVQLLILEQLYLFPQVFRTLDQVFVLFVAVDEVVTDCFD